MLFLFFVIFGTRGVTTTRRKGTFVCPHCAGDRPYRYRDVWRVFTLFFIPVLPLYKAASYVECGSCQGTYKPEILDYDPRRDQRNILAEFHQALRDVLIRMMTVDGRIDDREIAAIRGIYAQVTGGRLSDDEIRKAAGWRKWTKPDALKAAAEHGPRLNNRGKEQVIHAACLVAKADGELHPSELSFLRELGSALGMSKAHVRGVLAMALDGHAVEEATR